MAGLVDLFDHMATNYKIITRHTHTLTHTHTHTLHTLVNLKGGGGVGSNTVHTGFVCVSVRVCVFSKDIYSDPLTAAVAATYMYNVISITVQRALSALSLSLHIL